MAEPSQPRLKLKVDLDELAAALDDANDSLSYFLDRETGELVLITEEDAPS